MVVTIQTSSGCMSESFKLRLLTALHRKIASHLYTVPAEYSFSSYSLLLQHFFLHTNVSFNHLMSLAEMCVFNAL